MAVGASVTRAIVWGLTALSLVVACNGREVPQDPMVGGDHAESRAAADAGATNGDDASALAPTCVFPAPPNTLFDLHTEGPPCPEGCNRVTGMQLDKDENGPCTRGVLFGCCPNNAGCHGWTVPFCVVNVVDGRIVSAWDGTPLSTTEWRGCSHAEYESMQVPNCK